MTFQLDADIEELQFNADGTRLIGTGTKRSKTNMWTTRKCGTSRPARSCLSFENGNVHFSPDGKRVALADWDTTRTKVFDAQSGQIMLSVKNAGGAVAFSPDSKRLATQSGGMRIWDLETGDEINHIKGFIGDFYSGVQPGRQAPDRQQPVYNRSVGCGGEASDANKLTFQA